MGRYEELFRRHAAGAGERAFQDESPVDPEEIAAWVREIEEAAARIPDEEHERFAAALDEARREAKQRGGESRHSPTNFSLFSRQVGGEAGRREPG